MKQKRLKFQTPYFLFRNIETYRLHSKPSATNWIVLKHIDYIVNLLQQIETGENFLSPHFHLFWNASKQNKTKKGENSRPNIICFKTLNHIDYLVNLLQRIETGKNFLSSHFQLFRNKLKQKRWKFQTPYFLFQNIVTYRLYSKPSETNWNRRIFSKSTLSIVSKRFETKWNKKRVKIPDPIFFVSKQWNIKII